MKKTFIAILAAFALGTTETQAQSILDLFRNQSSKEQSENTQNSSNTSTSNLLGGLGDLVSGLLGKGTVNSNSLVGTWNYSQPAIVFESEDFLTNAGAIAAGKSAEKSLQTYLDKIGFTANKLKLTFNEDGTGNATYGTKNYAFKWSVAESDLTISMDFGALSKLTSLGNADKYTSFKMNCKVNFSNIQISFKADKLLEFITQIVSGAGSISNNATFASIAAIVNKVDGMYLGLTLKK